MPDGVQQQAQGPMAVLIAGPTASGKSALALTVAERIGGVVINTDSMQVYGDLEIITARPGPNEEACAPHLLYGHVDAAENYSVGRFLGDAAAALDSARAQGRVPIFTGGSGLYFKALIRGLAAVPPVPAEIPRCGAREARRVRPAGAPCGARGPRSGGGGAAAPCRPHPHRARARSRRGDRALDRGLAPRRHAAAARRRAGRKNLSRARPRDALYRRIDARFDTMLSAGALDEVRRLAERRLDPLLPAMKAHGVPWLIRHLAGEMTLDVAATEATKDTRHYAKRQFTWFRHQLADWPRVDPAAALDALMRDISR